MGYTLILGGARSGKSSMACKLAADSGLEVTCIATATPDDAEMAERIELHRAERPPAWTTIEEPRELLAAVRSVGPDRFLIVDCLTLWVSNLLGTSMPPADIVEMSPLVAGELSRRRAVVVSNEVGLGIVPANDLARKFRDVLGLVNARFAAGAERSLLLVAGRALELV